MKILQVQAHIMESYNINIYLQFHSDNGKPLPVISLDNTENKDSDVEEEPQSQKRPLVFGDSSDEEVQPTKRQKISDGEESEDDDTPLATIKQSGRD